MKYEILIILLILFLAGCAQTIPITGAGICDTSESCGDSVNSGSENFMIPQADLSQDIRKYSYDSDGVAISFFAVRGTDGKVRTAFDACDVCGGSQGYRQEGNDIICNKCGRHFSIDGLGTQNRGSGCWPSYIAHETEGEYISVSKKDLADGKYFFT